MFGVPACQGSGRALCGAQGEHTPLAHVADAGAVMGPDHCRAQIVGAVVQGIGTTLREDLTIGPSGHSTTADLRSYLLPHFGETPETEVHLTKPGDAAAAVPKPMSELPFTPVAAALANAVRDATGVRFTTLPLRPDTVWEALDRGRPPLTTDRTESGT
ncbi:molybdopterin cofactor-binding domain-containing protein [Streptomyces sp. NPDC048219]|uniref:molybdopterin cofactor-binding domain-containing protein n=1 Tax=unclassified Streptomyces TaxID=2593676 RepID=UPI0034145D1D